MRVTLIYTQDKTVIFYMLKLLLYEAGTKNWPICNLRANLFKSQAVGDIWPPQICPKFFLVEGLWLDRRIPNFQFPRPNGFFSREFRKIKNLGRNFNY